MKKKYIVLIIPLPSLIKKSFVLFLSNIYGHNFRKIRCSITLFKQPVVEQRTQ